MWAIISTAGVIYVFNGTKKFQREIHEDKLKEDAKNNKPAFVFEPLEIYYNFNGFNQRFIKKNWLYDNDINYDRNKKEKFENNYFSKSVMRFKNIGNGIAKNVKITYKHIDGLNYFKNLNSEIMPPLNHIFKIVNENEENHIARIGANYPEGNGVYSFEINKGGNYSQYSYRFINNDGYFEIPLNKKDMYILNYSIYHSNPRELKYPLIEFKFEYQDLYDNYYEENIFVSISNHALRHKPDEESITIRAMLDEFTIDKIEKLNRITRENYQHDRFYS
ncbi:hypothetical protein ABUU13_000541 [Staphylococcus aureus]